MPPHPQDAPGATSAAACRPERTLLSLGDAFYDAVEPARFPQVRLRFRNDRAAAGVGLAALDDARWIAHFGCFDSLPGSLPQPLALRYHGHQFRTYNPEIGDGRGFTFAQLRDRGGRLMDLGTKGSGRTPWSRFGDGRLTLKGGVREVLASEMLEALGVATSRSFSLIETGESLERNDEPSPTRGAVLVRLSHGHIRIGTFQRLAWLRDAAGMRALVGYVLRHLYGEDGDDPVRLLEHVVDRAATLAAGYMAAGFVHGVLNTDNINVTGESFDYGPWRFAPVWDPGFVAAYFDQGGLYAFGRQPEAIHWNVMQLAVALRAIAPAEPMIALLDTFGERYQRAIVAAMLWRLGRGSRGPAEDQRLIETIESALRATGVAIDRFFFDAYAQPLPPDYGSEWHAARAALDAHPLAASRDHPHWHGAPCGMAIEEVESIWSAIDASDDWSPFEAKIAAIRAMGEALSAPGHPH